VAIVSPLPTPYETITIDDDGGAEDFIHMVIKQVLHYVDTYID
jgi:hypothetical protein